MPGASLGGGDKTSIFFVIGDWIFKHKIQYFHIYQRFCFKNLYISENIHRDKQLFNLSKFFLTFQSNSNLALTFLPYVLYIEYNKFEMFQTIISLIHLIHTVQYIREFKHRWYQILKADYCLKHFKLVFFVVQKKQFELLANPLKIQ